MEMEDDSTELQDVDGVAENETINATTEDPLSDDNLEDGMVDHTRIVPINVNTCSGSLNYQSQQGYTVSVPATNVKIVKVVPLPHARSQVWSYFGFIADDDGEIQDKKNAICKICATTLAYSGNTTNLFTHLKAMHPEAQPAKLAPTNQTPRTGKKTGKRKLFEISDGNFEKPSIPLGPSESSYIIRAVTYSGNESSSGSLFDEGLNGARSPDSKAVGVNSVNIHAAAAHEPVVTCDEITNAIVNMIVEDCRPVCITQSKGFEDLIKLLAPGYKIPDSSKLKPLVQRRQREVQRNLILRGLEEE